MMHAGMRFVMTLVTLALVATSRPGAAAPHAGWTTWDAGLAVAREKRRPVLVDVYTNWCGWCRRMDREVYARADIAKLLADHFVAIRLDAESAARVRYLGRSRTQRELARDFGVTGYPTTLFLDADGGHLASLPGYLAPERMRLLLRYIGEGHVDRGVSWEEFSRTQGGR